jgi:hypothetical protein
MSELPVSDSACAEDAGVVWTAAVPADGDDGVPDGGLLLQAARATTAAQMNAAAARTRAEPVRPDPSSLPAPCGLGKLVATSAFAGTLPSLV